MAGLVFGLRHFKTYLLGRPFIARVDHMAITYYNKTPDPIGQQARHLDFISQFQVTVQYREGNKNQNVDTLSRLPPCEVENGEPCKQCRHRINGKHTPTGRSYSRRANAKAASYAN